MRIIPLTQGKVSIIDDDDFERVSKINWFYCKGYARVTLSSGRTTSLHRFILNAPPNTFVDHINQNKLDNRKANLRFCNKSQNMSNIGKTKRKTATSKYKGVYWDKAKQKWRAVIRVNMKQYKLGDFDSETDAAKAYNKAAKKFFGEFACLNEL